MMLELVTKADLNDALSIINKRITLMAEASQQDIDNLTTQVQQVGTDLESVHRKLQDEIDALANDGVDVTALQNAVAPLGDAVASLGNIQPTPPSTNVDVGAATDVPPTEASSGEMTPGAEEPPANA